MMFSLHDGTIAEDVWIIILTNEQVKLWITLNEPWIQAVFGVYKTYRAYFKFSELFFYIFKDKLYICFSEIV